MRDHRSNCVLRITPLKLMDLLWSLISELSSANLVSAEGKKKNLSRNEIHSVKCDTFCIEINLTALCGFCMDRSLSCPPRLSRRCWAGSPRAQSRLCCTQTWSKVVGPTCAERGMSDDVCQLVLVKICRSTGQGIGKDQLALRC